MSHSTHVGFNCPRIAFFPWDWRPDQRFAVGVRVTAACKSPLSFGLGLPNFSGDPFGVGHFPVAAIPPRLFTPPHCFVLAFGFIIAVWSVVIGVGNDEDSLSEVGRPDVGSG